MYFTREPVVETVISAKEGFRLVLRNSKGQQDEYSVEAVEVIAFGQHCFFRSLEKSKSFLLPVSDYEVLEVRETKVVLKAPSIEKGIKIGGGREVALRPIKETKEDEMPPVKEAEVSMKEPPVHEVKADRKKERRRFRKRKEDIQIEEPGQVVALREEKISLIPPPTTLISETISRYKDLPDYAGVFFAREEKGPLNHLHSEDISEEEKFSESCEECIGNETEPVSQEIHQESSQDQSE